MKADMRTWCNKLKRKPYDLNHFVVFEMREMFHDPVSISGEHQKFISSHFRYHVCVEWNVIFRFVFFFLREKCQSVIQSTFNYHFPKKKKTKKKGNTIELINSVTIKLTSRKSISYLKAHRRRENRKHSSQFCTHFTNLLGEKCHNIQLFSYVRHLFSIQCRNNLNWQWLESMAWCCIWIHIHSKSYIESDAAHRNAAVGVADQPKPANDVFFYFSLVTSSMNFSSTCKSTIESTAHISSPTIWKEYNWLMSFKLSFM